MFASGRQLIGTEDNPFVRLLSDSHANEHLIAFCESRFQDD